jgi:hypothetical protein
VHRDADAAAHHDAVDERHIGLRVALDERVERVFLAPELHRAVDAAGLAEIVERADVAAGRECPLAGCGDHDASDRRVARPGGKLRGERAHHAVGDRVERLRPVERDDAGRAAALEQDFGLGSHRGVGGVLAGSIVTGL